ncbi:MAG: platelet-activating factor acetylhydrolase IB subunit [Armatimonadota bacterium]
MSSTKLFSSRSRMAALLAAGASTFVLPASVAAAQPPTVPAPPAVPAPARPMEPANLPAPKMADGKIQPRFQEMHESFMKRRTAGPIGVLFLGDSITQGWSGQGKATWESRYTKYSPANFGIGGDRTQHVLWRIQQGELDGIDPKVVVLMIGTNNSGYSAPAIARANFEIVSEIHRKLPNAKLLLLAIFPRGADPNQRNVAALRAKLKSVNAAMARLDDGKKTRYLEIWDQFLQPDGVLSKEIMPDALHPNAKGYEIWADSMQPLLDEMMK